jgi:hypothetical protein
VTVADLNVPLYEPDPEPTQHSNAHPDDGDAEIVTVEPASRQPLNGETEPPPDGLACAVK